MPRIQPTVFVLWGERCDELVACTFVTVLRRAAVRVKLVGVTGRRNRGAYGLTLTPDLSLREALPLASHAAAVVIPCEGGQIQPFLDELRMNTFLERMSANQAWLVANMGVAEAPGMLQDVTLRCMAYPNGEDLLSFVQELSAILKDKW
jgi:hypothetical protein